MVVTGVYSAVTIQTVFFWSLVRSVVVALFGVLLSSQIYARTTEQRFGAVRRIWIVTGLLPLFIPELLTGFIWRPISAELMSFSETLWSSGGAVSRGVLGEFLTEALYMVLLLVRATSYGVVVRFMMPISNAESASLFLWSKMRHRQSLLSWTIQWLRMRLFGVWRPAVVAWCLMTLVSLQEFETAALMQLDRSPVVWTVTLFDAHAAHQPLMDSLGMLKWPLAMEGILLVPVIFLLRGGPSVLATVPDDVLETQKRMAVTVSGRVLSLCWMLLSFGLVICWPLVSVVPQLLQSFGLVAGNPGFVVQSMSQIGVSLMFSAAAAMVSLQSARVLLRQKSRMLLWIGLVPGLSGSLVTSLALLCLFQMPAGRILYDTWLPLLAGQVLVVLPRAVFMVVVLNRLIDPAAVYLSGLAAGAESEQVARAGFRIRWRLQTGSWVLAAMALSHWCFWDVTTISILRPVDLEPVVTRLYNEMHYGRTEVLMLMSFLSAMSIPAAGWLGMIVLRFTSGWRSVR